MVVVGGLESKLSDQLWLSFSLALAKPNNDWLGLSPSAGWRASPALGQCRLQESIPDFIWFVLNWITNPSQKIGP